jgi:hypothetical protein
MNQQMAQHIQSQGRGDDSVLVHMTPSEVSGLQALAMAHGGSLTINPETGLAEAGFLKKLLPMVLGAAGMAFGIPPIWMGALGAVGGTAITGDLKQGLMAGLGAFGGASLAGAAGLGSIAGNVGAKIGLPGAVSKVAGTAAGAGGTGAANAAMSPIPSATGAVSTAGAGAGTAAETAAKLGLQGFAPKGAATLLSGGAPTGGMSFIPEVASQAAAKTGLAGFAQGFGDAAKMGLGTGIAAKAAPMLAASGVLNSVSGAMSGGVQGPDGRIDNSYQGPYFAQDRQQILDPEGPVSGRQRRFFNVDMPEIRNTMGQVTQPGSHTIRGTQIMQPVFRPATKSKGFLGIGSKTIKDNMYDFVPVEYQGGVEPNPGSYTGYARGGEIELADGAFVVDARTVSEIGNGSSNAGIEALRRLGGRPVQGRGDGVSDSVPARIGKRQPARVARDEVIIPADAVRRLGKGNPQRGADKLYALMNKAHKARKKAKRGQDTKLRRGLA